MTATVDDHDDDDVGKGDDDGWPEDYKNFNNESPADL